MVTPVIGIIGSGSKCGKTTLIEGLLAVFKDRGLQVAVLKHGQHVDFCAQKDTGRHLTAGAKATFLVTPHGYLLQGRPEKEPSFADAVFLLTKFGQWDLILVEGYKRAVQTKIEICLPDQDDLFLPQEEPLAYVGENLKPHLVDKIKGKRIFSPQDFVGLADFIMTKIM